MKGWLTLNHDHVHVNGADGWLDQPVSLLQEVQHVAGLNVLVGLLAEGEHLPQGHPWSAFAYSLLDA